MPTKLGDWMCLPHLVAKVASVALGITVSSSNNANIPGGRLPSMSVTTGWLSAMIDW